MARRPPGLRLDAVRARFTALGESPDRRATPRFMRDEASSEAERASERQAISDAGS